MKIKVCGLRDSRNAQAIIDLQPEFVGFIFYESSPRFVSDFPMIEVPVNVQKVAVFVNETVENICKIVADYRFEFVQLHGNEHPEMCAILHGKGVKIIKAFSVHDRFEFAILDHYKPYCEYFLFDTKGKYKGGNGEHFNWNLLNKYDNEKAFFLSGGVDLTDVKRIKDLNKLNLVGIDVNSRFEISPAVKDVKKVGELIKEMRDEILN